MAASLESSRVIGDVIDRLAETSQRVEVEVKFGPTVVKDGVNIPPAKAAHAPEVKINGTQDSLYTLIASDPDPPDPANPIYKEWLHWLVTNISDNDVSTGEELAHYRGPAPPVGTHRYVYCLFRQPNNERIKASDPTHGKRAQFNTREFAAKHNLGDPVACVFHNAHK